MTLQLYPIFLARSANLPEGLYIFLFVVVVDVFVCAV